MSVGAEIPRLFVVTSRVSEKFKSHEGESPFLPLRGVLVAFTLYSSAFALREVSRFWFTRRVLDRVSTFEYILPTKQASYIISQRAREDAPTALRGVSASHRALPSRDEYAECTSRRELLPVALYAGNYKSDHNTGSNANLLDK